MDKKYYFWIAIVVVVAALIYLVARMVMPPKQDELVSVQCGNETAFRYKYPSQVFPSVTSEYSATIKITTALVKALEEDSTTGDAAVDVNFRNSVHELREKLNQDNIFFENQLRASFNLVNQFPCRDSLQTWYRNTITEMTRRVIEYKEFINKATTPSNTVASTDSTPEKGLIVDTTKDTVYRSTIKPHVKQLVISRDPGKLNTAIIVFRKDLVVPTPERRTER